MICRVILLLLLCSSLHAQTFNAAPFQGVGNTGIALKSIYSITNNAAGLSNLTSAEVALAYQANFVSSDLSTQALFVGLPIKSANFLGLSIHRYGLLDVSSILTMSTAYVRSFGDFFSTSISVNYHSFSIKNYGKDHVFSVDLGVQISALEQLTLGAIFRNVSDEMFEDDIDQYLRREIGIGIVYDISEDIYLSSDVYHDAQKNISVRAGLAYEIDNMIIFRVGASNNPTQYFSGIGLNLNRIKIDCSSSFHNQLGTSPQMAFSYAF